MGASSWEYVVPYQADFGAALAALRRQLFQEGDYLKPESWAAWGVPEPRSLDDLHREEYGEFMGTYGTHSIIDVVGVCPAEPGPGKPGMIRPLTEGEYLELFGIVHPGRGEYAPLANSGRLSEFLTGGRWTGRAAVLWSDEVPSEIVFWGYSGD
jgi:hypothetical protein